MQRLATEAKMAQRHCHQAKFNLMEYNEKDLTVQLHVESLDKLQTKFSNISEQDFPLALALHFSFVLAQLKNGQETFIPLITDVAIAAKLIPDGLWAPDQTFIKRILVIVQDLKKPIHNNDMVMVARYLIDTVLTKFLGIPRQHSKITATLCKALHNSSDGFPLIDLYPNTAELALKDRRSPRLEFLLMGRPASAFVEGLILLKLRLSNVKPKYIGSSAYTRKKYQGSTFLIDPPPSKKAGDLSEPASSLNKFLSEINLPCRIILISPKNLSIRKDVEAVLSSHKDKNIGLEAIIDFSADLTKTSGRLAVVLRCFKQSDDNKTLYLDTSTKNRTFPNFGFADRAIVSGKIFNLHQGTTSGLYNRLDPKVQNFLNAQFSDGYKNVKNICFSATRKPNSPTKINAVGSFIWRNQIDATAVTHVADLSNLIELLAATARPSCLFIIGNNGAGKSLLLRELITDLSKKKLTSVGISTTIQDRFPFGEKSEINKNFIYSGARTSSQSIAIAQRDKVAHKQTASILIDQEKLNIFVKCLKYLGYESRFYLMSKKDIGKDSPISEKFTQLSLTAKENNFPEDVESYEFGFVRADGSETIRSSSALSSGEQNINHLLLNIISHCERGRIFLIDEPEVSLHLQWQQSLPHVLHILSRQYGVSFVVATHSPTLITNANDPDMHCFQLSNGKLQILNDEQRYSVESIILDGFNTYTPNNRGVHEKCAKLVAQTIQIKNSGNPPSEHDALEDLKKLEELVARTGTQTPSSGMKDDLDLIKQARAAISLLLQETPVESAQRELAND